MGKVHLARVSLTLKLPTMDRIVRAIQRRPWSIWYADGSRVDGMTADEWRAAPSEGVQVVVEWRIPPVNARPWLGVLDRIPYTGEDHYDPFGWGVKHGSLMDLDAYVALWHEAFYGPR